MKKIIYISLLLASIFCYSQQIHVKYTRILSTFTSSYEDLYIKNNQVISIEDSIIIENKLNSSWNMVVNIDNGRKPPKQYYVSDLNPDLERDFFFTSNIDVNEFFIHDKVPKPSWKIEVNQTKKIAGYNCVKATGTFRGSKIIAYFTKELPYSAGPFKFYGLPGLILEIRVENKDYDIWKAESINIKDDSNIVFKPQFLKKEKISLKKYVDAKEAHMNKIFAKTDDVLLKSAPNVRIENNQRFTVEQKYEWETETEKK